MRYIIKNYKKFGEMINEGASPILYHFTYLNRLANILRTNSLFLTPTVSKSEKTDGKDYFVSFSRTKSTAHGYGLQFNQGRSVRIKFDGRKLNYQHKVRPFDYWQYPKTVEFMKKNSDEMEDRIISNNSEISDINKYIISIDIFMDKHGISKEILSNAEKLNIQLNIFDNRKDFASGNLNNTVGNSIIIDDTELNLDYGDDVLYYSSYIIGALTYKNINKYESILKTLKDKFNVTQDKIDKLALDIKKYHEKLDYYLRPNDDHNLTDLSNSIDSGLHNNKTSSNRLIRYITNEFLGDMRVNDCGTIKEYLNYKLYIGRKTQTDFNNEFNQKLMDLIDISLPNNLERLNYGIYSKTEELGKLSEYPPLIAFLNKKVSDIKNYISEITLTNDDMFRLTYLYSPSDIQDNVDIKSGVDSIINNLVDVEVDEILRPLHHILWDVDDFAYKEIKKMKKESNAQWGHSN